MNQVIDNPHYNYYQQQMDTLNPSEQITFHMYEPFSQAETKHMDLNIESAAELIKFCIAKFGAAELNKAIKS